MAWLIAACCTQPPRADPRGVAHAGSSPQQKRREAPTTRKGDLVAKKLGCAPLPVGAALPEVQEAGKRGG
jgi:hypothetical protein